MSERLYLLELHAIGTFNLYDRLSGTRAQYIDNILHYLYKYIGQYTHTHTRA